MSLDWLIWTNVPLCGWQWQNVTRVKSLYKLQGDVLTSLLLLSSALLSNVAHPPDSSLSLRAHSEHCSQLSWPSYQLLLPWLLLWCPLWISSPCWPPLSFPSHYDVSTPWHILRGFLGNDWFWFSKHIEAKVLMANRFDVNTSGKQVLSRDSLNSNVDPATEILGRKSSHWRGDRASSWCSKTCAYRWVLGRSGKFCGYGKETSIRTSFKEKLGRKQYSEK